MRRPAAREQVERRAPPASPPSCPRAAGRRALHAHAFRARPAAGKFIAATKVELFVLSKQHIDELFDKHAAAVPRIKETLVNNMSPSLRQVIDSAGELVESIAPRTPRSSSEPDTSSQIAALVHAVQGLQEDVRKISAHLSVK